MTSEGQLFLCRKDSYSHTLAPFGVRISRNHERRLRQVGLARKRLHLLVRQTPRIVKNGESVAFKRPLSKDV
jgi:hypothetical protein